MNKPLILTLLLTYACNLRCSFCGQNKIRENKDYKGQKQLSLEQVIKILDDAEANGIRNVNLWGGEPFLHPNIFDIIKEVKKRRMRCFIVTNGMMLYKHAEKIVDSKVDFLQISIDAPGTEHDCARGHKGLYNEIKKGIKKINELKRIFPLISSATVIYQKNVDKLSEIITSVFDIGINLSFLQVLMSYDYNIIGSYQERLIKDYGMKPDYVNVIDNFMGDSLTKDEFKQAVSELKKIKESHDKDVTFPNLFDAAENYQYYIQNNGVPPKNLTEGCWSLNYKINIQPNGDVVSCPDFPDLVLGNIFKNSINDIWNSDIRKKLISDFYSGRPLPVCYKCCQLWDKEDYNSWKGV